MDFCGTSFASNVELDGWALVLSNVMARVERFGVRVRLTTVVKRNHLIEFRAYLCDGGGRHGKLSEVRSRGEHQFDKLDQAGSSPAPRTDGPMRAMENGTSCGFKTHPF